MSDENLELVRSICSDWGRGDYRPTDWAHPEIEFVTADGPSPGTFHGIAGMAEGWGTFGLDLAQMHPRIAGLFQIRDGKVTRFVGYFTPERAFADLGLRE